MDYEFGLKELYDVVLKTTYPIEMDGKIIETGETIAVFDKIQIANFMEVRERVKAHGGYGDRGLVFWDTTKEVQFSFTQGIFSRTQFAVLNNLQLLKSESDDVYQITAREVVESDENGIITLTHIPLIDGRFFYKAATSEKITVTAVDDTHFDVGAPYLSVLADYQYNYTNTFHTLTVGRTLTNGFLALEGKTRVKDDITGQTHTGILKIPKLKLMSDLSMRLGHDAQPVVGRMNATAVPTGSRANTTVMSLVLLEDDIDSDM